MATDILDLVSAYVTLKKKGQNQFGLCPFHNEKSPSFSINQDKQIFHCFGCGAGGNVFTFLMRHEGIGFPEAVKLLAGRANIDLEWEERDEGQAKQNEALYHICEFAMDWFQQNLFASTGEEALKYFQSRGLSVENMKAFGLGYATHDWDGLIQQAGKTANDVDTLVAAGLALQKEGGKCYDRFRERIMFPIKNLSGRVVAFGGRVMKEQPKSPKYINSPETPVYEKSKILYGLFQNRDDIRRQDKAIFVEGYMDLLSLLANGIGNVVATSGTALTQEQAALIRRYTRHVVLMYDSDTAGAAASIRGADVLVENDVEVYIATLPDGHDPDSFVREFGQEKLLDRVSNAKHLFDYKLTLLLQIAPEKREEGVQSLLASVARVKDRIQRSMVVSDIAERLHVNEKDLWAELQKVLQQQARKDARLAGMSTAPKPGKQTKSEKAVDDLVRILLHDWSTSELIFDHFDLKVGEGHYLLPVLDFHKNQQRGGRQPTQIEIVQRFNDVRISEFIVQELARERPDLDAEKWAEDCILTIRKEQLQQEIAAVREQLKACGGEADVRRSLLSRCMALENEKSTLSLSLNKAT